jgi:hypothetical protein
MSELWDNAEFDDASGEIRGLVVLRTGDHRDGEVPIDDGWLNKAVMNFERFKTDYKYLPAVTLGHASSFATKEAPAIGYLDRLRKVGNTLLADVIGVGAEMFHALKKGAYPYRSLEFMHKSGEILRCAFLSRAPEIKTAPLIAPEYRTMFSGDPHDMAVATIQPDGAMEVERMPNQTEPTVTPEVNEELVELRRINEEQAQKIAEQNGTLTELAARGRATDVRTSLDALGVTPGVVSDPAVSRIITQLSTLDTVTKFAAPDGTETEQTPVQLFSAAVGSLLAHAKAGTLVKVTGEQAESTPDGAGAAFENKNEPAPEAEGLTEFQKRDNAVVAATKKLMEEEKIDYPTAYERFMRLGL